MKLNPIIIPVGGVKMETKPNPESTLLAKRNYYCFSHYYHSKKDEEEEEQKQKQHKEEETTFAPPHPPTELTMFWKGWRNLLTVKWVGGVS